MQNSFLGKRIKACQYALKGAYILIKTEPPVQVQVVISILMIGLGFYFDITSTEWIFQIFAMGLVLSLEAANTAIEEIADFIYPNFHHKIGLIKDMAAGAVFFAAITAITVGLIIYVPYFFN
ncbi:diacylglycerol kinase [Mesonia aestuariivivens]|uniref:Diacylglycerol kinase family protein n=1 Tax=Mesonia aestuariivivens TaxID=2796128 RepID=A0ABS6W2U2_9FLAO|nr:diacylglycerol kinase family protein [Mesonia aestuariivivens]MBW2962029.1 diacylglycerol kinase family protein [Mesonia aestuariivivens]